MTNTEAVVQILEMCGCLTAVEIASMAIRKFGHTMSPAQVSGALRGLESRDKVCASTDENGKRVFWLKKGEQ